MAKKDLQQKYEELFGEAPDDSLTVKQLEEAIAAEEDASQEEPLKNVPKKTGRVKVGNVD